MQRHGPWGSAADMHTMVQRALEPWPLSATTNGQNLPVIRSWDNVNVMLDEARHSLGMAVLFDVVLNHGSLATVFCIDGSWMCRGRFLSECC